MIDDQLITIAIASQPNREKGLIDVVYELLPQCDRMCICLNGYASIPKALPKNDKLVIVCAGTSYPTKDLGCNNKMLWLGEFPGYYATVDDDLHYPPNYIRELKRKVDLYNRKAICSFHGHLYPMSNGKIDFSKKKILWFKRPDTKDIVCQRLGMGVAMCYPKTLGLTCKPFLSKPKNFGDDEIMAVLCQKKEIPMVRISGIDVNILENLQFSRKDCLSLNAQSILTRQQYLESYTQWKLNYPENFYLRQQLAY